MPCCIISTIKDPMLLRSFLTYLAPADDQRCRHQHGCCSAGGPGNAYKFQAPEEHHERADVLAAQAFIERT